MKFILGYRQAAEVVRAKRVTTSVCGNGNIFYIGVSPSGKASDSDSDIPVFESQYPSHQTCLTARVKNE